MLPGFEGCGAATDVRWFGGMEAAIEASLVRLDMEWALEWEWAYILR